MNRFVISFDFSKISRLLFLLYIVYANVTSYSWFYVRGLTLILLLGALFFQLLSDSHIKTNKTLNALIVFGIYIVVFGLLVAKDRNRLITTASTFGETLIVFYLVNSYIIKDEKPNFPMVAFIIQALVAAYFTITKGIGTGRISFSENINVNTVGVMFSLGIGFIMYLLIAENNKPIKSLASVAAILVLLFGIMLTASKKAIISATLFIALWIIFCYRFTLARVNKLVRLFLFILLCCAGVYVFNWYTSNNSLQFDLVTMRMNELYEGSSDQSRLRLIKEGFSIFLSHPILGVGFDNVRYYTLRQGYTHCFYSELFACTGIIGSSLFIYALFRPFSILIGAQKIREKGLSLVKTQDLYIILTFLVLLALCFTQILFYTPNLMYVFSVITGYAILVNKREIN